MFTYPDIDPVFFRLGSLEVHWYGLMYLIGFAIGWLTMGQALLIPMILIGAVLLWLAYQRR